MEKWAELPNKAWNLHNVQFLQFYQHSKHIRWLYGFFKADILQTTSKGKHQKGLSQGPVLSWLNSVCWLCSFILRTLLLQARDNRLTPCNCFAKCYITGIVLLQIQDHFSSRLKALVLPDYSSIIHQAYSFPPPPLSVNPGSQKEKTWLSEVSWPIHGIRSCPHCVLYFSHKVVIFVIVFLIVMLLGQSKCNEHFGDLVEELSFVKRFFSLIILATGMCWDNRWGIPVYIVLCTFGLCSMYVFSWCGALVPVAGNLNAVRVQCYFRQ